MIEAIVFVLTAAICPTDFPCRRDVVLSTHASKWECEERQRVLIEFMPTFNPERDWNWPKGTSINATLSCDLVRKPVSW